MASNFVRVALASALAATLALPLGAQTEIAANGIYVHEPSRMNFPPAVGEFRRIRLLDYSGDGSNISAHYRALREEESIDVTVYIYPAPPLRTSGNRTREELCADEFDQVSAEVRRHPGARLLEQGAIRSPSPYHRRDGLKAVFALDSLAQRQGPLRSEADLFCHVGNKWSIKYRTTAASNVAYAKELEQLMRDLSWPSFPQTDLAARVTPASAPRP